MKIAVIFANGTEELEALTPVDVLKRANVDVDIVSVNDIFAVGSHKIVVKADKLYSDFNIDDYDGIVIPGGMPGAINIANNSHIVNSIIRAENEGKLVASICASPAVVLANCGVIKGRKATCYPAPNFISALGENYTGSNVEVSGNLITANGPKSAFEFSLAICKHLGVEPKF